MKKQTKKTVSFLMALAAISMGLGSCGKNTDTTSSSASNSSADSSVSETTETTNFNKTGYPIVNEPITLKIMAKCDPSKTNLDYNSMGIYKKAEEVTNIHIEWNVMKSGDEFEQKKNLMYTSGDYPDVILNGTSVADEENYGVQQQVLIPLTDYVNEEYMPNLTQRLEEAEELRKIIVASDGNIYGLPSSRDSGYTSTAHLFINKNFLDNVGLDAPKTLEEFEAVLEAFKTQDADGDGDPSNEIPYTGTINGGDNSVFFLCSMFGFPGIRETLEISDGKVVFNGNTDKYRMAMEWLNKAYTNGWFDPEVVSQDNSTMEAKIQSGDVGVFNNWRLTQQSYSYLGIEDDYVCFAPPKVDGIDQKVNPQIYSASSGRVVLTTANKYVPETLRWVDYFYQTENSIENSMGEIGTMVVLNDEGKYQMTLKDDGTEWGPADQDLWSPTHNGIYIISKDLQMNGVVQPAYLFEKYAYCEVNEPYLTELSAYAIGRGRLNPDESAEKALLETEVNKYLAESAVDFITNGVTDAKWDAYVQRFEALKLEEYLALCQKALDAYLNA